MAQYGLGSIPDIACVDINPEPCHQTHYEKMADPILSTQNFSAWFGDNRVVKNVTMSVPVHNLVAVTGPSGCGKTTFLRCINRMHELAPDARTEGIIKLNDEDICRMNPIVLRL